ncbi:hypothetical protein COCVIDRAFT_19855 [Bipolaris victoriae FI3]|uniref:Cytochrome P450 n=1 Tax=Bipolaris victoriae (strain FI3) TaxID=930091 RepID=W7E5J8_BIPV3|nr:hypothetical protein COCVIDRAFT_19855 [Bipolaris victoriae FI3]
MTLWIGHSPRIILSDTWVASDLLEKRSGIFSSRPRFLVMGDAINASETSLTNLEYGDRWRLHRRLMHTVVGSQAVRNCRDFQAAESALLIRDLFLDPNDFELPIERYLVSVASIIGWGRRIDRKNNYVAQLALAFMEAVDYAIPGVFIMKAIPLLLHAVAWL